MSPTRFFSMRVGRALTRTRTGFLSCSSRVSCWVLPELLV